MKTNKYPIKDVNKTKITKKPHNSIGERGTTFAPDSTYYPFVARNTKRGYRKVI